MKFVLLPLFWPLYAWLTIASVFPTSTANYDFLHVSEKEGLTITISKNSPPLAAIADELLPEVKTEPAATKVAGARLLEIKSKPAWKSLKKISQNFEKEKRKEAPVGISKKSFEKSASKPEHTKISELLSLVEPVNYAQPRAYYKPVLQAAVVMPKEVIKEEKTSPIQYVIPPSPREPAPTVDRRLPRGEEAPPVVTDHVPQAKRTLTKTEKAIVQKSIGADGDGEIKQKNIYTLLGQIELQGGLAVGVNTLKVEWKTGAEKRSGAVDYSSGQFSIEVPLLNSGKIFATLLDTEKRVIGQGLYDLTEQSSSDIKVVVEPLENKIRGSVMSAYSYDNVKITVPGAEIFAPTQIRELVGREGNYKIQGLGGDSTFILEAYAPDNWGTRIISEGRRVERVPLFSNKMLQSLFDIIGEPTNNTEYGIIWGEVKKKNNAVSGVKVALGISGAMGPIYFNELRIPDKNLKETTSNGLFAFVKVPPGLHTIYSQKQNFELPSRVVAVGPSLVSYAEMSLRSLNIQGQVYDPLLKHNIASQISIVGTKQTTAANGDAGFGLKIPATDAVLHIDAYSGPEYFTSRTSVAKSKAKEIAIQAIPKKWLLDEMEEAKVNHDPKQGIVVGFVKGPEFHVRLDNENFPEENIYYFNENAKIDPSRVDGLSGEGMFLIRGLKPGLHTVVISSGDGLRVSTQLVVSEANIVNVINTNLNY